MSILITGGTGFIGSHTVVELIEAGETPIIVDNLCNSKEIVLDRIETITGKRPKFYKADLCDAEALDKVFTENPDIESVIHFAGMKAVGESVAIPAAYYYNNLVSTLNLCEAMKKHGVKIIVFSSSATVYGDPAEIPIKETTPLGKTTNPYGETKQMIERILSDIQYANRDWSVSILRYFNPVGAHKSGLMGEDPKGIPNNLFPYVTQVATGRRSYLNIFGDDYDTPDGTGVRDYIHVVDLARAHLCALNRARAVSGVEYYNVGTGHGYSVLDIVKSFEAATGKAVPYKIVDRRPGDIATCYADATKAKEILGWEAQYDMVDMCRDADRWQTMNPNGYDA
ncbi:MAG: UDP-glucose 4-epimerase GalE [Clostridia bacterium]|nr:UDP-glucose 4-epimerase GalE [Clostridia bacterium]